MRNKKVTIIDYGAANVLSVARAFEEIGASVQVATEPNGISRPGFLVLPGVGAFGYAMKELKNRDLVNYISRHVEAGNPLLGICLGMQLLLNESEEFGHTDGFGFIEGKVIPIKNSVKNPIKLPHVGWKKIDINDSGENTQIKKYKNCTKDKYYYFVHSFRAELADINNLVATCKYGENIIPSIVAKGNIVGSQFHPEKSSKVGLDFLRDFLKS